MRETPAELAGVFSLSRRTALLRVEACSTDDLADHRIALTKVTEAGPWTEPAWRAAATLGLVPAAAP